MFKKLILTKLCCFLILFAATAQSGIPTYTRSTGFEEPESGSSRIVLMKNGNTLFFHFTPKKGIDVTVFDQKHRSKGIVNNKVDSWKQKKMRSASLKGVYEINGQAVVFIQQSIKKCPTLYRMVFDGKSGKKIKEDLVGSVDRTMGKDYGMAFGGISYVPNFSVSKDPYSDYYAVGIFNTRTSDRNARVEVIHYSPEHKEINRSYFESPENKYKYLSLLDMYVNKDEFVFIGSYAFNTKSSGGEESRILVGRMQNGKKGFQYKMLDYTDDYRNVETVMKYSQANKQLYMLAAIEAESVKRMPTMDKGKKSTGYVLQMNIFDPFSLELKNKYFVEHPKLTAYVDEHLKAKRKYLGIIQDFKLNDDNTITYLFEEMDNYSVTNTYTSYTNGRMSTRTTTHFYTDLGSMGIVNVDQSGKELRSYAIAKDQTTEATLDMFDVYSRKMSNWNFRGRGYSYNNLSGFYSYDYMFVNDKEYVIYNENVRNTESEKETTKDNKNMGRISLTNTVYAYFDGSKVVKSYLFGDPGRKDENRFCQLEMNTASEDGKSFATMMIERKGRDKQAYIAWVNF
ncbi:hypothetical protein [Chitinophaga filiformis]|uniref:Uncharacterized protein n=1 Tax=Chitinophaga filiformis TaxID=104663 RepID=A0A1G8BQL4_CHIFI|nr:hypothetical protein [Chitinophaga filiformis]SDH35536.1 hypothetical protein SAMN04488121_111127 [Chitinophaga filiformis]